MLPTPASIGTNVRTTGTNRAITTVLGPCSSKNVLACVRGTRVLKNRRRALNSRGPDLLADREADLVADHGGREAADQDGREVAELALVGEKPGDEQERVAGEEEAEQEARTPRR